MDITETDNENQNEKNQQIEARTQSDSLTNFGDRENRNLQRDKLYLAETAEVLRQTLSLSNQPNLTEKELGQRASDWMDAFEDVIPVDRIADAFKEALRIHVGTFPVNAFEILDAWKAIKPPPETDWERQKRLENVCVKCGGSGFETITGFDYQGGYSIAKKCTHGN